MQLEFAMFERTGVTFAHQVTNQTSVFTNRFGAGSIRDSCGLYDRSIVTHPIHQSNMPMLSDLKAFALHSLHVVHVFSFLPP
jgi:hypothetical protein